MSDPNFRLGPFSTGDLIAIASIVFMAGTLWYRVGITESRVTAHAIEHHQDSDKLASRIQALEQIIPINYVRRDEYREDTREIKAALGRIEMELKSKVDK